ncbi:MAG: KEOPS complex subunit Pcc1 [Halohasta sp.]
MTDGPRTAKLRTDHGTPTRAAWVARAVEPDNTDSMSTAVDGSIVETRIQRETTGGLETTVDDYVVNVGVAAAVIEAIDAGTDGDSGSTEPTNEQPTTDTPHHE